MTGPRRHMIASLERGPKPPEPSYRMPTAEEKARIQELVDHMFPGFRGGKAGRDGSGNVARQGDGRMTNEPHHARTVCIRSPIPPSPRRSRSPKIAHEADAALIRARTHMAGHLHRIRHRHRRQRQAWGTRGTPSHRADPASWTSGNPALRPPQKCAPHSGKRKPTSQRPDPSQSAGPHRLQPVGAQDQVAHQQRGDGMRCG